MKKPEYALLSVHERNNLTEEEHFGIVLKYTDKEVKKIAGNSNGYPFFQRSCMKPLQLAAISEILDNFEFTNEEIAVMTASHSGEDFHIKAVSNILKKIGLTAESLLCPPQMPLNRESRNEIIKRSEAPKAIHNNCSGKHAAMLAYCVLKGYEIKNYTELDHPLQKHILNFVAEICGLNLKECEVSRDGCTLPVIATPLENLAKGFLNVYKNYQKITNAVLENPYFAGGHGRFDSEIMIAGGKNLIAKVGAGNICCVADLSGNSCYVIKVLDGDNFARGIILTEILKKEGKLPDIENSELEKMYSHDITDETGFSVGKIKVMV